VLAVWKPGIEPGSPAEMRMLRRLLEWDIERPDLQVVVRDPSGRFVGRLDAGWPRLRIGLEYDGLEAHGLRRMDRDERRHGDLEALGWRVRHADKADLLPGETGLRDWLRRHVTPAA
jgi:hypothetical protein